MMDLVKPPTDNLYKFKAVAGLVLIVLGAIYIPWLFYRSTWVTLDSVQAAAELAVHRNFAKERQNTLNARKQQVEAERNKLQTRIDELVSENSKNANSTVSGEIEKLETRMRDIKGTAEALADAEHELNLSLHLKDAQAKHKQTVSINERRNTRVLMSIAIPLTIAGIAIAWRNFRRWDKRLQRFQDVIVVMQATATTTSLTAATQDSE